ncbi:sensor histidine kinase [Mucilaginibacter sp. P19]|uniref:sensor histidine kinase n=1 Tax=Mucilaginibacter sp. P19 TaxID=3423947 RepID=UPI003D67883A
MESLSFIVEHYLSILGPDGKHEIEQNQDDRIGPYVGNFLAITLILLSTTFKLFVRWMKDKERINELNNLTLRMELNELRNQINPHFLFNMLNNVKALIRIDAEKATVVIMKLSEFLRYQLYENNEGKTSLHSELQFLSNLAELEKIRRDNLTFTMNAEIPKDRLSHILLPPNLFTTFLENAIKYSVDINGKPETIEIYLSVKDQTLCFKCCNSKGVDIWPTDAKSNGLGLANIQRRLELLYADLFKLDISSTPTAFSVNLIIPI